MVIAEILNPVEFRINSKWKEMVSGSPVASYRTFRLFGFIIVLLFMAWSFSYVLRNKQPDSLINT